MNYFGQPQSANSNPWIGLEHVNKVTKCFEKRYDCQTDGDKEICRKDMITKLGKFSIKSSLTI